MRSKKARAKATASLRSSVKFFVEGLENRVLLSAGDLDTTFGTGGKVLVSDGTPTAYHQVQSTAVQSDGKIVMAGSAGADQGHLNQFFVERLNANGTPDATFGTGGVVTASFGSGIATGKSLVIQSDGAIVVGGTYEPDSTPASAEFAVARFTSTGGLDGSFGTGGKVLTRIPGSEQLGSVSLAPGGKIVAVGSGTYQDPAHPGDAAYSAGVVDVARYSSDGTPDPTFNGTGYAYLQSGQFSDLAAVGAVQGDGKILVGGNYGFNPVIYRFNVDGTLDASFGLSGRALLPMQFGSFDSYQSAAVSKMVVQPNGQIVVAGKGFDEGRNRTFAWLGRFNGNGLVDTAFGNNGLVIPTDLLFGATYQIIGGLTVQTDGKIVLAGTSSQVNPFGGLQAERFLPNGSTDPGFNSSQVEYFSDGHNSFGSAAAAMSPNGTIVIAGNDFDTQSTSGIFVTRLQNDGTPAAGSSVVPGATPGNPSGTLPGQLDGTFGVLGRTAFLNPSPVQLPDRMTFRVNATTVLSTGRILLAGSSGTVANNGQGQFFLERLNADGTVDPTFGTNGSVVTSVGNYSWATSILVQSDGKIILGGASVDALPGISNADFALVRYNANGILDTTFGTGGKVITDFSGNEQIDTLAFGPGGTIVAAGSFFLYPDVGFDVARYTSSGALDTSLNATGMLSKDLGQTGDNSRPTGVAVQSDGKIVVGSHLGTQYAVYRFSSNGSVDGGFGTAGVATINAALPPNGFLPNGAVTKLAIQPDGKIVAAGQTSLLGTYSTHALARFNVDGSLDPTFGSNGAVILSDDTPTSLQPKDVYSLAALILQPNGEILLVGNERNPFGINMGSPGPAPMVRKFLPDGSADPYFVIDQDPQFIPPPPFYPFEMIQGAALAPNGQLIVAANIADPLHWGGVARYLNNADYFNVTSLADDGSAGTLRYAMNQANGISPGAVIGFQPGLSGTIHLTSDLVESGNAASSLFLKGPGANVIAVEGAIAVAQSVTVSGLTLLSGGVVTSGAQIYSDDTIHGPLYPSNQSVSVQRSSLLGDGAWANVLASGHDVTIQSSTVTGYTSTVLNNITNLQVLNTTISGNGGYALGSGTGNPTVGASILAGNGSALADHADVLGAVNSLGHNLVGNPGSSTGWVASDVLGTPANPLNPQLLSLGMYGGTTPTMPPKPGSPAIGAGGPVTLSFDQRGIPIVNSVLDSGSVQSHYLIFNGTSGSDSFTLQGDSDPLLYFIISGGTTRGVTFADPLASVTINGNGGSDTIVLDYQYGKPIPTRISLNGTFTVTGLQGANPFAGSTIDLGSSTVYFVYASGQSPAAAIRQALKNGYGNGTWGGFGGAIMSTAAAANPGKFGLGYADSAGGTVSGQPANTVEVRYALNGDTNLNGLVDIFDLNNLLPNFNKAGDWTGGDSTYNGVVDIFDLNALLPNFNTALPATVTAATNVSTTSTTGDVASPTPSTKAASVETAAASVAAADLVTPPSQDLNSDVSQRHTKPKRRRG